ncbi:MAG TPA: SRPBCC family protein [Solirubrobacteraceae bacterium]|nr:SRPBCC family protein [Solirubrobacteraceae bacterium]
MARYRATIDTPRPPEEVFAYLSDFSSTQEWDPGVVSAERLSASVELGTEFRLHASFLGRTTALTYRIVAYDPPRTVTLRGENATVLSNDTITVDGAGEGSRVTYDAELTLKGPLGLADPLLDLAFHRVGDRALAGLRRKLGSVRPDQLGALRGRGLDGRDYELPGDLIKPYNLTVFAFRRNQQALVDRWLPWLTELEQRRGDVAVYELPVLSSTYGPMRWLIDGGMTRGISDPAARARTVTVYTDVSRVTENLGLADTETIAVLVVEPSGRILARERGGYAPEKAERLAAALTPEPPADPSEGAR